MSESHEASISHVISAGGGGAGLNGGGAGLNGGGAGLNEGGGRVDGGGGRVDGGAGVADVVEVPCAAGRLRARGGFRVSAQANARSLSRHCP